MCPPHDWTCGAFRATRQVVRVRRATLSPAPPTRDEVRPFDLHPVVLGTRKGKLWNEFVARYHYLGCKTLVGVQMRNAVHDRDGWPVTMLGFNTEAWKLAPATAS